ncbi:MAG: diguanylate cyclase [Phycisphaerales bacterium]
MSEHSHAERMPQRIELSAEELALLLGADRFAPEPTPAPAPAAPAAIVVPESAPAPEPAPAPAPRALGDTEIVGALLEGAPNFEALLLRVLRERTQEPLARIVEGATADAMIATGTATAIATGRALVAPTPPELRESWARWLQRWLELHAAASARAPRGLWDEPTGFPSWPRLRTQAAHRIAAARLRREPVHLALLRIEDAELWNRRAQVLVDDAFLARAAAALDAAVTPGDELARLDDGAFVAVSSSEDSAKELARALRAEIARLPGDGPRSLAVHVGVAVAPWDAVDPQSLLEMAARRLAQRANGR